MGSGKRLAPQTGGFSALLGRLGFTNCLAVLLVLLAMFLTASTVQNIYIIVAGMVVIAAGELVRLLRLPKDITAHLTDTGLRER